MKTIVAGSRGITDDAPVWAAIASCPWRDEITEIVSGGARGVDTLGEAWARDHDSPVTRFIADWDQYGGAAGLIRNGEMADYADALILVWDGVSRGSRDMLEKARSAGIKIHLVTQHMLVEA